MKSKHTIPGDSQLTGRIIGCAMLVSNTLGPGFLEKVYENALVHEMRKLGLTVEQQVPLSVIYDGVVVGDYLADIVVESQVVVELKAGKAIDVSHQAQMLNYLKTTGLKLGLILNFGTRKLGIRRFAL